MRKKLKIAQIFASPSLTWFRSPDTSRFLALLRSRSVAVFLHGKTPSFPDPFLQFGQLTKFLYHLIIFNLGIIKYSKKI